MLSRTHLPELMLAVTLTVCSCGPERQESAGADYSSMELKQCDETLNTDYSAAVRGKSDIQVFPQISGCITKVCVEEGEKVKKGQLLFIIDQVPYKAALETASANEDIASAEVSTAMLDQSSKKELFSQNVISSYELKMAENKLSAAQAKLRLCSAQKAKAANDLSYTSVQSPSEGVVGTLPFKVGALVGPSISSPLTTISDNSQMFVYFSMTENQLLSLMREYGSTTKALESMPDVKLELSDGTLFGPSGKIESISGVIDPKTGSVSLKAVFPNKEGLLHSGGSGKVVVPRHLKDAIVIPESATFEIQDKIFVFKVSDGAARSAEVKVSKSSEVGDYIVESGLEAGDKILSEGVGFAYDGMKIKTGE